MICFKQARPMRPSPLIAILAMGIAPVLERV
jgi:hypothetical protein